MASPLNRFRTTPPSPTRTALVAAALGLLAAITSKARRIDRKDENNTGDDGDADPENRRYDLEEREIGVKERRFRLLRQQIFVGMTVAVVVAAIVFPVLGVHAEASGIAGGSGVAVAGAATLFEGRRQPRDPPD
jgi:hypothetical protein